MKILRILALFCLFVSGIIAGINLAIIFLTPEFLSEDNTEQFVILMFCGMGSYLGYSLLEGS